MTRRPEDFTVCSGGDAPRSLRAILSPLLFPLLLIALAGCGGGGGAEVKTGSNGTGIAAPVEDVLAASGPITTLGPTGIGGTALDDAGAAVQINAQLAKHVSEIRLGMVTETNGNIAGDSTSGTARTVSAQSALVGPVTAVDAGAQRLTVMSVPVTVDQNTIFDGFTTLAALAPGARVEVYGLPQLPANTIAATRIAALAASAAPVELLGAAHGVTALQFVLDGVTVATGNAVLVIGGITQSAPVSSVGEDARVRVVGSYDAAANSVVAAQVIGGLTPVRNDYSIIVLDGLVQSVTGPGRFRVNDTEVDAVAIGVGIVSPGGHVQVRGRKVQGTLVAGEFRQISAGERIDYTIQGEVTDFVSTGSFKVRGEAIGAASAVFTGGIPADLANGRRVRIKASAGPGRLTASAVTFLP